jgi:hypothetical protein
MVAHSCLCTSLVQYGSTPFLLWCHQSNSRPGYCRIPPESRQDITDVSISTLMVLSIEEHCLLDFNDGRMSLTWHLCYPSVKRPFPVNLESGGRAPPGGPGRSTDRSSFHSRWTDFVDHGRSTEVQLSPRQPDPGLVTFVCHLEPRSLTVAFDNHAAPLSCGNIVHVPMRNGSCRVRH